jgi:hypothetical protein
LPAESLQGAAAASGFALITAVGNVGPSVRTEPAAEIRSSSGYETASHFLLDLIVRYAGNTALIHCLYASSNFFVPRSFDLAAFSWLIQVEQQSHERQSLVSWQLDNFFGYLLDARGHVNIL